MTQPLVGAKEQLQEVLGVQLLSSSTPIGNPLQASSSSSVLHINRYTPTPAAAAAAGDFLLQGDEAHVDKGLLTVIWATQPGLQVGA